MMMCRTISEKSKLDLRMEKISGTVLTHPPWFLHACPAGALHYKDTGIKNNFQSRIADGVRCIALTGNSQNDCNRAEVVNRTEKMVILAKRA